MPWQRVQCVFFSPTGTTKKIVETLAAGIGPAPVEYDFTPFHQGYPAMRLGAEEVLIVGCPVYSGRVPRTFAERLACLEGQNTPAVLVATYGNRDYDDALLELQTLLTPKGFAPIAAAAFAAEHSAYRPLGAGRPDEKDQVKIEDFAKNVAEALRSVDVGSSRALRVSGNAAYREYRLVPMQPHSTRRCSGCGACAKMCPSGAIPTEQPQKTDTDACIRCMRCIRICPRQARRLSLWQKIGAMALLARHRARKEPAFFFRE